MNIVENYNPFQRTITKPGHLNILETLERKRMSTSDSERRIYAVALQKKYTTLFLPFVITLFSAPFALTLSRKGNVITIGIAVSLWLAFTGLTNFFEQFGTSGALTPEVAIWSPLVLFTMIGLLLLSRVRT